jgi:predicted NAD-dependent protein-ADP-ribosyltransferase YbiA (DUF1768 family)
VLAQRIMRERFSPALKKIVIPNLVWDVIKCDLMNIGLKAKLSHQHMQNILLATGDKILVEASPYDKYWSS